MTIKPGKSAYQFFTTEAIKPEGWLLNQLKIQAEGLSGNLDKFWPDIKDSAWIGGSAEGWERVPYWLDGFIPLAYLLNDTDMKQRAKHYIDSIIIRQNDDGWICPVEEKDRKEYDMWALFLILKVLVVWHDATGDKRIESVVSKALKSLDKHIDSNTLSSWAQTRWFECLISIYWLYNRTEEQWLLELAVKLRAQGFDWVAFFENWPMELPVEHGRWNQMSHVVNQSMMLKSGPLYALLSCRRSDQIAAEEMFSKLEKWHGMVNGMFTGDECLSGLSPVQGTELCAVVETMYSLEWLLSLTGEPVWGDRLERIAFNALPATFSPDMKWHQYDQQVNQIECSVQTSPVFRTNGSESNLFGVEPNFGCCTANLSQGWPKLALSSFMHNPGEIAIMLLLPASLNTELNGVPIKITIETEYPFRNTARINIKAQNPVSFSLKIRIPNWAEGVIIKHNCEKIKAESGSMATIFRTWENDQITVELPMQMSLLSRPNNLYSVERGPLIYSIPITEKWVRQNKDEALEFPWLNNWEVFPSGQWNYALILDKQNPAKGLVFQEHSIGEYPFSPNGAPIEAIADGKIVPWEKLSGALAPAPSGDAQGSVQKVRLIPYGCTNLRLTEIPLTQSD